ncbi:hypothetical protein KJ980_04650 [Patescibacteria group bacterium]|nr:hypothetical protein [Patescibacteria group bacterium]MBU4016932.1 hypothetical protein [Patescibacteria group bacterium]MBU4098913.1 hypothetical protein [Patescibacteria group bacterium]
MKERDLSALVMKRLPELLPQGFSPIGLYGENPDLAVKNIFDIEATMTTPKGEFRFIIEVKNTDRIAPMREAAAQVKQLAQTQKAIPFVASAFLGDRAREALKKEGVGYLDLAGNFYLNQNDFYVEKIVERNPFSATPPLKNLFAPISSRITRALLLEPKRTWRRNTLAQETRVSIGQTYSVVDAMLKEEFIFWNDEEKLQLKDPAALLNAWKNIYPTYRRQKFTLFSYEQDYTAVLNAVLRVGQQKKLQYALGFFTGADLITPFIRGLSKVQFYTQGIADIETWKTALNLQEVQSGGNTEIYVPYDKGVFYKTQQIKSKIVGDIPIVNNVQLYMDLFNNPARGEEQAQHLREEKLKF